ncbi:MAG: SURF1 family protein [Rhodocyclaceae bacterium]|nr:SURF1 family protein [Rhodocyclaceae bacterium]
MTYRFRPALLPGIAAAIMLGVTLGAGRWQLARAHYKEQLRERFEAAQSMPPVEIGGAELDARELEFHPATATGRWLPEYAILLDNRVQGGVAGYELLMPLQLAGSTRVLLVNRGWVRSGGRRERLPEVATPAGELRVSGRVRIPGGRFMELAPEAAGSRIWQNLTLERYAGWSGLALQPFVLEQTSAAEDGLVRDWPAVDFGTDRHYGYALQWFAFAAITVFLFLFLSLRKLPA